MQNQPSEIRFGLRTLFLLTAFVGFGLLALMYPYLWVKDLLLWAMMLINGAAVTAALLTTGARRAFWTTFAVFCVASVVYEHKINTDFLSDPLWLALHAEWVNAENNNITDPPISITPPSVSVITPPSELPPPVYLDTTSHDLHYDFSPYTFRASCRSF